MDKHLKGKRIRTTFKEDIEPQEIFLDAIFQKKEAELGITEKKMEVLLSKRIFQAFGAVFLLIMLVLFAKTFQFQIIQGQELSALAEKNKLKFHQVQAVRGVIYDKNLEQLVSNQQSFNLVYFNKSLAYDEAVRLKTLGKVAEIIKEDAHLLEERIRLYDESSDGPWLIIVKNIDYKTLILLEAKIAELPGFQVQESIVREYVDGPIFSHLLGYIGRKDNQGKAGLEEFYEEELKENPGIIQTERDALGNPIKEEIISFPRPGNSLVLWLDADLQRKLDEELRKSIERVGAKGGAAVALDPNTGGILALVSVPSFDNNLFSQAIFEEEFQKILNDPNISFFNRIVASKYPTGSVIKPLVAAAALEENIISAGEQILCTGEISVPNPFFPDEPSVFHDWKVHGWTDLRKALAESCNVYFYLVGGGQEDFQGLGVERIKKYLQLFGWGEKTGIDIPGEKRGLVPDPAWKEAYFENPTDKIWRIGDTYNFSIGQGYLGITPLQVAASFGAIANGGKLYQPRIAQQALDTEKKVVKTYNPNIIRENFIVPENLKIVREGMRDAVIYGSSVSLNSLPIEVAAKTGTAQISKKGHYHSWVSVFAPYDNPEIVLVIIVEEVEEGQIAALPVAEKTLSWYFKKDVEEESSLDKDF